MPSVKSPFVEKPLICPICQNATPQRFFRLRVFVPEERESDQHVTRYKWQDPKVRRVHPGYYALYYCPECRFTDTAGEFSNPRQDDSGHSLRRAFKKETRGSVLVQLLGRHLNYEDIDFESALDLHFLAITIHSNVAEDYLDAYKLGRLYLRVAWLYREQNGGFPEGIERPELADAPPPPGPCEEVPDMQTARDLLAAVEALEESLGRVASEWDTTRTLLRERIREIAQSDNAGTLNPYPGCFTALDGQVEKYQEGLAELKSVCLRDVTGVLLEDEPTNGEDEVAKPSMLRTMFPSHEAYLAHIKTLWPEVPLTEKEAIERAEHYFDEAISTDLRFSSLESHLKLSMLVADLKLRRDDLGGALEIARGVYRAAMDDRQKAQKGLTDPEISDTKYRRLKNVVRQADAAVETVTDFRYEVLDLVVERHLDEIKSIMRNAKGDRKRIEAALTAADIPPEVLTHLQKRKR